MSLGVASRSHIRSSAAARGSGAADTSSTGSHHSPAGTIRCRGPSGVSVNRTRRHSASTSTRRSASSKSPASTRPRISRYSPAL